MAGAGTPSRTEMMDKLGDIEDNAELYRSTPENDDLQSPPSPLSSKLEQYRDNIRQYYERQVRQQQPLEYIKDFNLYVEDTFTTIDILLYNERRQAFDRQPLKSVTHIFNPTFNPNHSKPSRIVLWGAPGMGKTTLIAKLLTEWNRRSVDDLRQYDFVFAIALRKVERTQALVDCIFDQLVPEDDVNMREVLPNYLRDRGERVLIILDGYDELEWQPDKDHDIVKLLTGRLFPKVSILVTTRPTCTSDVIDKMRPDTRVEILGFSPDNACSYISKFFERQPDEGKELLKKIGASLLHTGIFSTPILLLQVCLLWEDDKDMILSNKIFPLYNNVVDFFVRRYRAKDKNPVSEEDVQTLIHALERLAFECLLKEVTMFNQEDVRRHCGDQYTILVQIGLLKEQKSPSRKNPIVQYSFSHKTMQEYFAARHLAEKLRTEEATKREMLQQYFPTARKVQMLGELLIFTCGKLGQNAKFVLHHLLKIHSTSDVQLVEEEFYNFFKTGRSKKDWNKDIKLEDFASPKDLTQFAGQWNDYPQVLLTYQSYIELYLLCCHESGLTSQFAEQVFLRDSIQFSGASPRVYSVLSHMIAEESEKMKRMEHLRLVNTQNYVLGSTLEELHKLPGLTELNLRQSRLGRHLPKCTIPKRLELRFKHRRLTETSEDDLAKAPALLAEKLPHLRSLKKLVISFNDLSPEDMKQQILPAVRELTDLEELFLSGNDLRGLGKDVAELVALLTKLKAFKVYFCQLTFEEIQRIASSLKEHCPDLTLFDFQLNPIQPDESIWIGEEELKEVKRILGDKVFIPSGSKKLPPTTQGP